jgi:virulence factor Mce-like protein
MNAALRRPNLIARGVTLAAFAGAVIAVIVLLQASPTYTLRLEMSNANGIRPGSQVLLGGVSVGTVGRVELDPQSRVIVRLDINPRQARIGVGTTVHILAANLLGEEYVALNPGNPKRPLASGSTLPMSAVTVPTDLDQILNVLDPDTQRALSTLINEAGIAVAGRKSDVSAILRQLPLSVEPATKLLTQLVQDDHTLKDLIASGNQFVARVNLQSGDLGRVIEAASGAATTAALRAGSLSHALVEAPRSLVTMQKLLASAGVTTRALTKPAGEIANSAGPLAALLAQVQPFEQAAVPALNRAASVSPQLTQLGEQATPIVQRAVPTLAALENIAKIAQPLTYWLGADIGTGPGIDGLLGVVQGWAQAIQFRDGLGHTFHGAVNLDPSLIVNLANLGVTSPAARRANERAARKALAAHNPAAPAPTAAASGHPAAAPTAGGMGLSGGLSGLTGGLTGLINGLTGAVNGGTTGGGRQPGSSTEAPAKTLSSLLGYLLGK